MRLKDTSVVVDGWVGFSLNLIEDRSILQDELVGGYDDMEEAGQQPGGLS